MPRKPLLAGAGIVLVLLAAGSHEQTTHWRDGYSIYRKSLESNPHSTKMLINFANELLHLERKYEARDHYMKAYRLSPDNHAVASSIGIVSLELADTITAEKYLLQALDREPRYFQALWGLGVVRQSEGNTDSAIVLFRDALKSSPRFGQAHKDLAESYFQTGKFEQAAWHFAEMAAINSFIGGSSETILPQLTADSLLALERMTAMLNFAPRNSALRREAARLLKHLPNTPEISAAKGSLEMNLSSR